MADLRRGLRRGASAAWVLALWCMALAAIAAPALPAPPASEVAVQGSPEGVPAPRIGVLTMQPGEIFFERFGHNAIVVQDPVSGAATSFNFGYFDPYEADFVSRFVRGVMRYRLLALPVEEDLAYYRAVGRGVSMQWLDLAPADARALADALAENARPENAYYRYDYFLDNCSTRVRDALDRALGGELRRQLQTRSRGNTFRSEAVRLASPAPWMWLVFDIGLGPSADRPLPIWNDAFVPMRLADALDGARRQDGSPVVHERVEVLQHRLAPAPREFERRWTRWLAAGLAIGVALAWLGRRRPRLAASLALPFWAVCGLLGVLMLYIWLGTDHRFGWANQNLLLMNPLAWLLLPGGWRLARSRGAGRVFSTALVAMAGLSALAVFVYGLQVVPQRNAHWIALLLPIHAALAWSLLARRRTAGKLSKQETP
ncbi:lipoprotein N-acyltransferase Lnb domain-containing protein [Lysobacter sp. A3-1-A15]|uniref:lipoprotein N-acyltransferase Lnb domain-containing protein n=1 Tax=Novilysobacter viscosus TaxID=3098602 RepID=UPI002EDB97C5